MAIASGAANNNYSTDVIVSFNDDQKYIASFFSYQYLLTLAEENRKKQEIRVSLKLRVKKQ